MGIPPAPSFDKLWTGSLEKGGVECALRLKWLLLLAICLTIGCGFTKTLVFTQADLQAKLVEAFPVEKEKYFLTIELSDPVILLIEGSDRVGLEMASVITYPEVKMLGKTLVDGGSLDTGRFAVAGKVIYDGEQKAIYLGEVKVEQLNIVALPDKYQDAARKALQEILDVVLKRKPIYQLKDETLKQKAKRVLLRDVMVKDGHLQVKVGVG